MTPDEAGKLMHRHARELVDWMKRNAPHAAAEVAHERAMIEQGYARTFTVSCDAKGRKGLIQWGPWSRDKQYQHWSPPLDGIPDDSPPFSA